MSAATDEGYTALAASVNEKNLAIAAMLVKAGADVNARYIDGQFALYRAVNSRHLAMVTLLVTAGARADMPFVDGETPLHLAAILGSIPIVSLFIKVGVNVNVRMAGGYTALHRAAQCGHGRIVKALLATGADPLLGYTDGNVVLVPLDYAVAKGGAGMVNSLLEAGGGIGGCGGESGGLNAFRYAARVSALDTLSTLSREGVRDDGGALLVATDNADASCVRMLLKLWAENRHAMRPGYINTKFSDQSLPLCGLSASRGSVTPLTLTVRQFRKPSSYKIVKYLLELGADTTLAGSSEGGGTLNPCEVVETCLSMYERSSSDDYSGERLKAIGRLLKQRDAILAVSWLWPSDSPVVGATAARSAPVRSMIAGMKRRVGRSRLQMVLKTHEARAARAPGSVYQ